MNFNFANNPSSTPGSGFSFGNTATTSSGFSFAQKPSNGGTTGFSFGNTQTPQTQSFKLPTNSSTQNTGGFSFGNSTSASSQPASSAPGFGFGSAATNQNAKSSFGFGTSSATAAPTQGLGFSGNSTASAGFKLNATSTNVTQSGLNFGAGATSTSATTGGFSFGGNTGSLNKPSGVNFGISPALTSSQSLGATTLSSAKSLSFGFSSNSTNNQQSSASTALNFGSAPLQKQGPSMSSGFSLNQQTSSSSNPPAFSSSLTGLLASSKQGNAAGFQQNASVATASSTFQLPGLKTSLSTAASKDTFSTTLMPSAGKFSLNQPVTSAPTANTQFNAKEQSSTSVPTIGGQPPTSRDSQGFIVRLTPPSGSDMTLFNQEENKDFTALPSTKSTPAQQPVSSSFGFSSNPSVSSSTAASSKPLGFSLTTKPASTLPTATTTAASTLAPASTPALKYKELEAKINKWKGELEQQEHLFITQATQVNARNKLLINNSEKITSLSEDFDKVSCDQERLNQELDFIKTQQDELESLLAPLEEATKKQAGSMTSSIHTHHADVERERTYNLAGTIDCQLKRMVQDLKEVIDHVNVTTDTGDVSNPVNQISKILSAHMDSLQWLDSNSGALQNKLDQLTKQVNERKMQQENRLRLAFD